jgi:predicted PurR-regulated permease PerM
MPFALKPQGFFSLAPEHCMSRRAPPSPASDPAPPGTRPVLNLHQFSQRTLVVLALAAVAAVLVSLVWFAAPMLLLTFAGILLAIFLNGLARFLSKYIHLRYGWSLLIVVTILIGLIVLTAWLLAPRVNEQVSQLTVQLPEAVKRLEEHLKKYPLGRAIVERVNGAMTAASKGPDMVNRSTSFLFGTGEALIQAFLVIVIGLYGAATPDVYVSGFLRLVPIPHRERGQAVLHSIGETMWLWLITRVISMAWVALTTMLGLWLLGIPLALTMGIMAGIFKFVPYVGPILAVLPPALLAVVINPLHVFYVAVLYFCIEMFDDHVVLPLLQWHTIWLPPILGIFAQILFGGLYGALGVLLAVPVMAVLFVAVKMLYIEDTLGDQLPEIGEEAQHHDHPNGRHDGHAEDRSAEGNMTAGR